MKDFVVGDLVHLGGVIAPSLIVNVLANVKQLTDYHVDFFNSVGFGSATVSIDKFISEGNTVYMLLGQDGLEWALAEDLMSEHIYG
tara:strand:- start:877 stop:1134 length:258 start_codon:yes stop_codon:yes gene_type:complete